VKGQSQTNSQPHDLLLYRCPADLLCQASDRACMGSMPSSEGIGAQASRYLRSILSKMFVPSKIIEKQHEAN
jgi:hypothetical protein